MKLTKFAAVACSLAVLPFIANGQTVLSEPFSYPDGPLVGAPGSPWTQNTGTAGQLNVLSGELQLSDAESEDAFALFSQTASANVVTAIFDIRIDPADVPTGGGDYFAHFRTSANGFIGRVFAVGQSGGAATQFRFGLSTNAGAANAFSINLDSGTTYTLTLSYDFATDVATLSIAGVGLLTATDTNNAANLNSFQFRQPGGTIGDAFVDNLVVMVPEPGTYMLLGLGALVCGQQILRRRKA